jgi:hypothetical protein
MKCLGISKGSTGELCVGDDDGGWAVLTGSEEPLRSLAARSLAY